MRPPLLPIVLLAACATVTEAPPSTPSEPDGPDTPSETVEVEEITVDCFADADGDGFAGTFTGTVVDCAGSTVSEDCDDLNPATWPGAPDLCDGVDHDCDGVVITGADTDGDGWPDCGAARPTELWSRVGLGTRGGLGERLGERVAWQDVTGDGAPELIVSAPYSDGLAGSGGRVEVRALARDPDGVVRDRLLWAVQGTSFGDAIGFAWALVNDVNGDTLPELAVAIPRDGVAETSEVHLYASPFVGLAVLLDRFEADDEVPARSLWGAGDLNGDGRGDIVWVREPPWPANPVLQWVPGTLSGLDWGAAEDIAGISTLPVRHGDVLATDIDGDGYDDLVLGASVPGGVTVVPGGPAGPGAPRSVLCPGAPLVSTCGHGMVLHDLTGDGILDLLATAGTGARVGVHAAGGGLAILPGGPGGPLNGGPPAGTFLPHPDPVVGVEDGAVAVVGDLDGDGSPELMATGTASPAATDRDVRLWRSVPGGWVARPRVQVPPPTGVFAAVVGPTGLLPVGDLDSDGLPDVLVADPAWRPGNGSYFGRLSVWAGAAFGDPAPADPLLP